jgi:hypothetical protein
MVMDSNISQPARVIKMGSRQAKARAFSGCLSTVTTAGEEIDQHSLKAQRGTSLQGRCRKSRGGGEDD